jgi:hypothetical protein
VLRKWWDQMMRFFLWLLPYWLGPNRECSWCHEIFPKEQGLVSSGHWYCSEEHADEEFSAMAW